MHTKSYINASCYYSLCYDFYPGVKETVLGGRQGEQWPPREVHFLILRTCDYVELHGKGKTLRLQMELRLLIHWPWNEEIILDYLGGPNLIRDPYKREAGEEAKLWWHKIKHTKKILHKSKERWVNK